MHKGKIFSYLNHHYLLSIILYSLFFILFYILFMFWFSNMVSSLLDLSESALLIVYSIIDFIFAFFALSIAHKIHNISLGFTKKNLFKGIFVTGFVAIVLSLCTACFTIITHHNKISNIWLSKLVVYTVFVFSAAFYEEILFRGLFLNLFIIGNKRYKNNYFIAVIIVSVLFSFSHFQSLFYEGLNINYFIKIFDTFCAGIFFSAVYIRTKNIWVPIVLHSFSNEMINVSKIFFIKDSISNTPSSNVMVDILSAIITVCIFSLPYLIAGIYILKKDINKNVN